MSVLHHHPMSAASRFIRLCLSEYKIDVDFVEELPWTHRPEFLAMNPSGTLPVLMHDTMNVLCGPYILAEYLDETYGIMMRDHRLLPENSFERAEVRRLVEWFLQKFEQDVVKPLLRERVYKLSMSSSDGSNAPDSSVLRTARGNMNLHMKYLSWLSGTRAWLGGTNLSYADLAAAASISLLDYLGEVHWAQYPQAKDWYQRIKSRPSFRPLLAERVRNLPPVSHYADLDF